MRESMDATFKISCKDKLIARTGLIGFPVFNFGPGVRSTDLYKTIATFKI